MVQNSPFTTFAWAITYFWKLSVAMSRMESDMVSMMTAFSSRLVSSIRPANRFTIRRPVTANRMTAAATSWIFILKIFARRLRLMLSPSGADGEFSPSKIGFCPISSFFMSVKLSLCVV